jgi:hypothetical protein
LWIGAKLGQRMRGGGRGRRPPSGRRSQDPQRYIDVLVVSAKEKEYLKRMIIMVH